MELLTEGTLKQYLADDTIGALMQSCNGDDDEKLICQKWLRNSAPKRLIFDRMYGDLLRNHERLRVLDVGGGITCLTRLLAAKHTYDLIDLMAHDDAQAVAHGKALAERQFLHVVDWYDFVIDDDYDVVVANDLFPNVDQRLKLFLKKFLPISREIRLSLTFYQQARFYMTRRVQGEEVLCMLAWDGETTARTLESYVDRIVAPNLGLFAEENASLYPNGRQVCLIRFMGGRD